MASHTRKLWAGGILLALGGTAAAAMSADPPTAAQKASGTAPVEVRTEVIHKTVHKRAKAHRAARVHSSAGRGGGSGSGRGGEVSSTATQAVAAPGPVRIAPRPTRAPARFVSRGSPVGRSGEHEEGDDRGEGREREHEDEHEHSGGDD